MRPFLIVAWAVAVLGVSASSAEGQRQVFVEGLSELTVSLAGTYGDEGARIESALDTMARGLVGWDTAIRALEDRLASALPGASPQAVVEMRAALASMYAERGRHADALREVEAAIRLAPERADLHVLRGVLLQSSNRFADAAEAFGAAWAANPHDPPAAYHAFRQAAALGRTEDAQGPLDALVAVYGRLLRDEPAASTPFVSLDLLPDIATYPLILPPVAYAGGYDSVARRDYDEAVAEFRQAAAADPLVASSASELTVITRVAAAIRQGRLGEARGLLEDAVAQQSSSETHRLLGVLYGASTQYEEGIAQLEMAIREDPRNERARLTLARVLGSAGRDVDAEQVLRETIDVFPESTLARWWLASLYQRLNRFADAQREYELGAASATAGRTGLSIAFGRLAADGSDLAAAGDVFARAVVASPNDPTLRKSLAGVRLQQAREDEAFVELVAALVIDPSDAGAHAAAGQIHLNAGRYDAAVPALRRALELSSSHVEARYALATALTRLGRTEEGTRELERFEQAQRQGLADRRRQMALDVLREEAELRTGEGRHDRAAELWQQVVEREPGLASNQLGLARSLDGAGRTDAAIARYEIVASMGVEPEVYRRLAELYAQTGRRDDASRAGLLYYKALQGQAAAGDAPR